LGIGQEAVNNLFVLGLFAQTRLVGQGLFDAHRFDAFDRDHLGQAVHLPIGHLQHAADVAHGSLGQEGPKGDDLAHPVTTIFFLHVLDHLLAAIHAKVDVKVGHANPLRIQEPLKEQAVTQRIKVGDGQRIGHQTARARATTRTDWNIVILGPFDEIGHDQEIAGKAHALDDAKLEFEPFLIFLNWGGMGDYGQA